MGKYLYKVINCYCSEKFDGADYDFECDVCETSVMNSSKHCGVCNRCTDGFDHHCRWLNTCVGAQNYIAFFRLIILFFSMAMMHTITNVVILYQIFVRHEPLIEGHNDFYGRVVVLEF